MKKLYKVWFDCKTEEEAIARWRELVEKGYEKSDIYIFRFQGNDGSFHREVFIFND